MSTDHSDILSSLGPYLYHYKTDISTILYERAVGMANACLKHRWAIKNLKTACCSSMPCYEEAKELCDPLYRLLIRASELCTYSKWGDAYIHETARLMLTPDRLCLCTESSSPLVIFADQFKDSTANKIIRPLIETSAASVLTGIQLKNNVQNCTGKDYLFVIGVIREFLNTSCPVHINHLITRAPKTPAEFICITDCFWAPNTIGILSEDTVYSANTSTMALSGISPILISIAIWAIQTKAGEGASLYRALKSPAHVPSSCALFKLL